MRRARLLLWFVAPVSALLVAMAVSSIALLLIHKSPLQAFELMGQYGAQSGSMVSIVNRAVPLFLSGLAVAIGFKMNLFNIGVEGQSLLGALLGAAVGGAVNLPAPLEITIILLTAMAAGAAWSGIAGVLKVTRGVHEVISTIMLNAIATGVSSWLLLTYFRKPYSPGDLVVSTRQLPQSGWFPPLNGLFGLHNPPEDLSGFVLVAILVGVIYYVLVWRTRFGYDLRASGINPLAARVSGVDPNRMVIQTMLLSGAMSGLVGMMYLLSFFHAYTIDFPTGLGFTGIAVALVGRNHPVGIGLGALLFGFIERSAQILDLNGIPKEIFQIMEGTIILAVVIAYEVVRRMIEAQEVRAAAEKTRRMVPEGQEAAA